MGQRDRVTGVVDGADLRRVGAVCDHGARLRRVLLVGEGAGRDVDETRVGDVQLPVGHRPGHRLHQEPRRLSARPAVLADLEALEEVQHLQQGQAPCRRAGRRQLKAAIGAPDGLGDVDPVRLEVFFRDEPAVGGEISHDRLGDLTSIEHVGAVARQLLEGAGEVCLDHHLTDRVERAVVRVDGLRGRRDLDPLCVRHDVGAVIGRPVTVHVAADRESVPGDRDRGLDRLLPGDGAESVQRLVQARHRAGHADRLVPHIVDESLEHVAVTVRGLADEDRLPLVLANARPGGGSR